MSVINQMLKDLGERQTRSEWRLADMLDRESPSLKLPRNYRAASALLVLGGVLALGIAAWQQWPHPAQPATPALAADAGQTSTVAQPAAVINSIGIQADGESLRLVLESDKAPTGGTSQVFNADGSIDYTLANARVQAALPVLAENSFIKSYSLTQHEADVVLHMVPSPNAQGFIEPAATGEGYRTVIGARARHVSAAVTRTEQASEPVIEKPRFERTARTPKIQTAVARSAPVQAPPANDAGAEKMQITRSVTSSGQADTYYRQALQELQAGRVEAAQSDLRKAVNLQPDMHAARELLAALLLRSGQSGEAYAELQRGMQLDPGYTAYARLYAQSLIEAGDPAGALRVLEVSAPYAEQQADYRALMAAVAQRLGKHDESVRHYRAALALKSSRSGWWVGMAISLEALGQPQEAAQAYRTALAGSELNPDLMNYARARVAQLGPPGGTGAGG